MSHVLDHQPMDARDVASILDNLADSTTEPPNFSHKEHFEWRPMEWPLVNDHLFPQWNSLQQQQQFQHQMHLHNQSFFSHAQKTHFGSEDIASALLTSYNDSSSGASSPPGCLSSSNSTTSTSSGVSCLSPNSSQPASGAFTPSFNFFGKNNPPFDNAPKEIKQVKEEPVFDVPRKKSKKGPAPKLFGNERCKICDSRATGFHYNVLSCEACKNFFRRAVVHKLKYECKNGSNCCSVQSGHRPRCQYCRMTKCREMGMKDEYINRMGRNRKSQQKTEVFEVEEPYKSIISNIDNGWAEMGCQLTEDERLTVVSDPLYKMEMKTVNGAKPNNAFEFMNKMAALKVKKITQFCKHIPQWDDVDVNLQIKLIKGGLTEAMVLYNTADFNPKNGHVRFMDGKLRSKEAFYSAGFNPDIVNTIFSIWEYLHSYGVADSTTVALLMAACLTSPERCAVKDEQIEKEYAIKIDEIHTSIVLALQKHLRKTQAKTRSIFAKALYVLVKLRDISDGLMPQQLNHFELLGLNMQPLFCEIYNK